MLAGNLGYHVDFVTSEDEAHPSSQLLYPGPSCKGWASAKYCSYPQEIIMRLESQSTVETIQIMFHALMVPTGVEIWLGDFATKDSSSLVESSDAAVYFCLGEVPLDKRSDIQGRQLLTIELNSISMSAKWRCSFVKLVFMRIVDHKLNVFNQIGVMGVALTGTPSDRSSGNSSNWPRRNDLRFLLYTDRDVAEIIHQLEGRKYQAVAEEQFERVKRLKEVISELMVVGIELGAMEVDTMRLVDNQEYEAAKDKKTQMEEMRQTCYRDLRIAELLQFSATFLGAKNVMTTESTNGGTPIELPPATRHKPNPEKVKANKPPEEAAPVSTTPDEDPQTEQLSPIDRSELSQAIHIYGLPLIKKAIQKRPSVKEEAADQILEELGKLCSSSGNQLKADAVVTGTTQILTRLIRDRVWAVFTRGIGIMSRLFDHFIYAVAVNNRELSQAAEKVMKELLVKMCDHNERVQDKANSALESLLSNAKVVELEPPLQLLLTPLTNKEHPKMQLTKAELVLFIMDKHPQKVGQPPLTIKNLTKFALSAINSSTSIVKKMGESILVRVYKLDQKTVEKLLPGDSESSRKSKALRALLENASRS